MPEISQGLGWVIVVNLVLWTGIFLYLLRINRRLRAAERAADVPSRPDLPQTPEPQEGRRS